MKLLMLIGAFKGRNRMQHTEHNKLGSLLCTKEMAPLDVSIVMELLLWIIYLNFIMEKNIIYIHNSYILVYLYGICQVKNQYKLNT